MAFLAYFYLCRTFLNARPTTQSYRCYVVVCVVFPLSKSGEGYIYICCCKRPRGSGQAKSRVIIVSANAGNQKFGEEEGGCWVKHDRVTGWGAQAGVVAEPKNDSRRTNSGL